MSGLIREYFPKDYSFFDFHLTSENPQLLETAEALVDELGLKTGRKDNVKVDFMVSLLANVFQGGLNQKMKAISRTPEYYSSIPESEKLPAQSSTVVTTTLNALIKEQYIIQFKGQKYEGKQGELTKINATDKLMNRLSFLRNSDLVYLHPKETIVLRNDAGESIEFPITEQVKQMQDDLTAYNELLGDTEVSLAEITGEESIDFQDTLIRYTSYDKRSGLKDLVLKKMQIRRIFNLDFENGGRLYGGIENLPSQLRPRILVNGKTTVELDYSAYQLRMVYHKNNIKYTRDGYSVAEGYTEDLREIYKLIALITFNSQDELSCLKAISSELRKTGLDEILGGSTHGVIKPMMSKWQAAHPRIRQDFYSGIGLELQAIDSGIANSVLKHFREKGILVLSVHDSFLIEKELEKELRRVMRKSYHDIFGFYPVIK